MKEFHHKKIEITFNVVSFYKDYNIFKKIAKNKYNGG
jgi:hypothetical protein